MNDDRSENDRSTKHCTLTWRFVEYEPDPEWRKGSIEGTDQGGFDRWKELRPKGEEGKAHGRNQYAEKRNEHQIMGRHAKRIAEWPADEGTE